jgi:hypothetical protein
MIFLLMLLGYVLVYAIFLMMIIAFACGLLISFGVYVLSYVGMYTWARLRHRTSPEWHYERKQFALDPNTEEIQGNALVVGILTMVDLVIGFVVYAFTNSWEAVGWWVGIIDTLYVLFWLDERRKPEQTEERPTWGEIRDRHDTTQR